MNCFKKFASNIEKLSDCAKPEQCLPSKSFVEGKECTKIQPRTFESHWSSCPSVNDSEQTSCKCPELKNSKDTYVRKE